MTTGGELELFSAAELGSDEVATRAAEAVVEPPRDAVHEPRYEPDPVPGASPDSAVRVAVGPTDADGRRESVWVGYVKSAGFKQPAAWWLAAPTRRTRLR